MEPGPLPTAVVGVAVLVDEEDAEGSAWPEPTTVPVGVPPRGSAEGTLLVEVSSFCGAFAAE